MAGPQSMESEFRDQEFVDDLCRLDREMERSKSIDLERCELLVRSSSANEPDREWIPASEWRTA
jgi:hypothetical protein